MEYAQHAKWIRERMPILVTFEVGGTDDWIRRAIQGQTTAPVRKQCVVVQGTIEQDRLVAALANLKVKRGLPYGGAMTEVWRG